MKLYVHLASLVVLAGLGATMVGCGSDAPAERPRADVSGNVTLDGSPLPDGEITFVKVAEGVNDPVPIVNGKYAGKASVGDRKVEIRAYREVKANTDMYGADAPVSKENFLPEKFNVKTELKDVTISKDGPNNFDFEVTSK
jgi:predicted small lipoprotein YifL